MDSVSLILYRYLTYITLPYAGSFDVEACTYISKYSGTTALGKLRPI